MNEFELTPKDQGAVDPADSAPVGPTIQRTPPRPPAPEPSPVETSDPADAPPDPGVDPSAEPAADPAAGPATEGEDASEAPPKPPAYSLRYARERIAHFLGGRGASARGLAVLAVVLAALAATCFLVNHEGLGGLIGLLALMCSLVALAPAEDGTVDAWARAFAPLGDLLLAGGFVAGAAGERSALVVLLGVVVLLLFAWLPHLRESHGRGPGLWFRGDRVAVFAMGALLGRVFPALLILTAVGCLQAWFHLDALRRPATEGSPPGPGFLAPLLRPDGTLLPPVRWGSLLLTLLLLLVLPQPDGWRF